ncbi:MAG TPA: MbcA/ParS/Xre antitoxin family protein [Bryobacteraceae bacterium]|jgi:hypothetical protein|nr:MbcA/ParS/Xre antitoxin family protein [Bryobacteraceae bacterium]
MPTPAAAMDPIAELDQLANSTQQTFGLEEIRALRGFLDQREIDALVPPPFVQGHDFLTEDQSAQVKLVARIISHVASTFGPNKVLPWLHEPFLRFGQRPPLDLMKDHSGAQQVEEYLVQIDEGYFA